MKPLFKVLLCAAILHLSSLAYAQIHINQNGLQTSVTGSLSANGTQSRRYEIAVIGFNSYHWQAGGTITVELYDEFYQPGYEKYIIEVGFGYGGNYGTPEALLVESFGSHSAKITLGSPFDLSTSYGGYVNKAIPVYLDVRYYATYKAKITYLHNKTEEVTSMAQIKINTDPVGIDIPDFTVPVVAKDIFSSGNLQISGSGSHYIQNGNVGIGTTAPDAKLTVKGKIHAEEIKVDLTVPGPDYVFEKDYPLKPLQEIEKYILKNKHLPEIPNAGLMKQHGINMGEMQMKQLQKIEELTLYLIEQNKKIEALQQQMEQLKREK